VAAAPVYADPLPEELADDEPFDLTGMQAAPAADADYDEDYDDDVDGIVDPLAGLRGAEDGGFRVTPPSAGAYGQPADDDTLDLGAPYGAEDDGAPVQDDLLADADRLAAEDRPVEAQLGGARRRGLLGGAVGGAAGGAAGAGSTLFERMANLSRSSSSEVDDDEDDGDSGDGGPALSIPRFLGRQNNQ
jgi:cell division protein FtsZ